MKLAIIVKLYRKNFIFVQSRLINVTVKKINIKTSICLAICLLFLMGPAGMQNSFSQPAYEHISNKSIYTFLDEMANDGYISLNSAVKPYTRSFILSRLQEIEKQEENLNTRQKKELDFYLGDFGFALSGNENPYQGKSRLDIFKKNNHFATALNPFGFFYKDSLFTMGARPIWGIEYLTNQKGDFRRTWGGARVYGQVGKHLGFYASLRDNHMSDVLQRPEYFSRREGGVYKGNSLGGGDYSEMRGGIVLGWKWGELALAKDHLEWGDNTNGSIINNGQYPSFGMIKLHLKPAHWVAFNYFHGWLVSEVVDSVQTYLPSSGFIRPVYKPKYMAANMFTVTPFKRAHISFGNSIIYGDIPLQAAYLVPIMFFKSIDHTVNAGIENQNSQMFANLSIRRIRHVHLYGSLYIDELSVSRIGDPDRHNFYSWKAGAKISNWPLRNVSLNYELSRSVPLTYQHRIPVLTYATNRYNLGYYLGDNSQDYYLELSLRPFARFLIKASYLYAVHGNEYTYAKNDDRKLDEYPFMEDKSWDNEALALELSYQFSANASLFGAFSHRSIQGYPVDGQTGQEYLDMFTPGLFHGNTRNWQVGFHVGF